MYEGLDAQGEAEQIGQWVNHSIFDKARSMGYIGSFEQFSAQADLGIIDPNRIGVWRSHDDPVTGCVRGGCGGLAALLVLPLVVDSFRETPMATGAVALVIGMGVAAYTLVSRWGLENRYGADVSMLLEGNRLLGK